MNDQSVRVGLLDALKIQKMFGRAVGPARHPLLARNLAHHNAQKIAAVVTFVQNLASDRLRVQSRAPEQLAVQPGIHQPLAIFSDSQISKPWLEEVDGVRFASINRKCA